MDNTYTPEQEAQIKSVLGQDTVIPGSITHPPNTGDVLAQKWAAQATQQQPAQTPSFGIHPLQQPQDPTTQGINKIGSSITEGAQRLSDEGTNDFSMGSLGRRMSAIGETGLGTATGALQTLFSPITALTQKAADVTGIHPLDALSNTEAGKSLGAWAQANPRFAKNLSDAFTVATADLGVKGAGAVSDAVDTANGAKATFRDVTKQSIENSKNFVENNITGAHPDVMKIQQVISPKLTPTETKLALDQGRIIPGQDATLLKDGTPDQVIPSNQTARASETIANQIPGAGNMKAPELYSALDTKISSLSKVLRPQMESAPITPTTIEKITNDWNALKAKQASDPYMPTNINLEKLQNSFEKDILQGYKSDNVADLWDSRIKYDNSVPASVKNATSLSSEVLQSQKSMWLQNRGILNDAINDGVTGLGKTSQKAFSDMSDMYNAQKGIQSSYKPSVKEGAPSKLKQLIKDNPKKSVAIGLGATALTGIPQKLIGGVLGL